MKGSLRKVKCQNDFNKNTNFNDWNDSTGRPLKNQCMKLNLLEGETGGSIKPFQVMTCSMKPKTFSSELLIEVEELRKKLRESKPLMNIKEFRMLKLPFYESLLLNLNDGGFRSTYAFINDLIMLDDKWHEKRDKNLEIKNRPCLKSNPLVLNTLSEGLTKAEVAKEARKENEELKSFLVLALKISSMESSWYWIAKEMYEQCVYICNNEALTDQLNEELVALSKHLYAKFLLEALHNLNSALINVEESMVLSSGKSWSASELVGKNCDILYIESCLLRHKIYLEMSLEKQSYDTDNAIHLCRNAWHWAKEINCKSAQATALLNLVTIYLKTNILDHVVSLLENYMKLCKEQNDVQGLCEGHILYATYHKLKNQDELVVSDILDLLKIAEENKIEKMIALAHRKLATVFLMQGKVESMQQHAIKAYNNYVKLNSIPEMEECRCLVGLAQAQEIMPQYLNILLEAESVKVVEFDILVSWKSLHIPFFYNTQLFQPESEINMELKNRVGVLKNEEILSKLTTKTRQLKMTRTMSSKGRKSMLLLEREYSATVTQPTNPSFTLQKES